MSAIEEHEEVVADEATEGAAGNVAEAGESPRGSEDVLTAEMEALLADPARLAIPTDQRGQLALVDTAIAAAMRRPESFPAVIGTLLLRLPAVARHDLALTACNLYGTANELRILTQAYRELWAVLVEVPRTLTALSMQLTERAQGLRRLRTQIRQQQRISDRISAIEGAAHSVEGKPEMLEVPSITGLLPHLGVQAAEICAERMQLQAIMVAASANDGEGERVREAAIASLSEAINWLARAQELAECGRPILEMTVGGGVSRMVEALLAAPADYWPRVPRQDLDRAIALLPDREGGRIRVVSRPSPAPPAGGG